MRPISDPRAAAEPVVRDIKAAARATGVSFDYLLTQATRESGLRSDAKAATSSARGLFQFIDQTWLDTVRKHGAKHGLGEEAAIIGVDRLGRASVADPADRQRILDLRNDPAASSAMAAEFARDNKQDLERSLGRPVGAAELGLAHFLGAAGAATILGALDKPAAELLPAAAAANRSVFYAADGESKTARDLYKRFAAAFGTERAVEAPAPAALRADAVPRAVAGLKALTQGELAAADALTALALKIAAARPT